MPIATALTTFRDSVAIHKGYISKAFVKDAGGNALLSKSEQAFVVDAAFLRIFIAWECFLESAFTAYLLGHGSSAGKLPVRFAAPPDPQHAKDLLVGTQKYVDWANPDIVRKLAGLYFQNGEPIRPAIAAIQSDLFDLKTIRNAAAHLTVSTSHLLDALASRRLNRQQTGITVSDFVLSLDPSVAGTATILETYLGQMDSAASQISNWS